MIQKLKDEVHVLSGKLANVQFTYRDPTKNFDRSKVKGVVAKLIKVKDASTMTALEVCFSQICITWLFYLGCGLLFIAGFFITYFHVCKVS